MSEDERVEAQNPETEAQNSVSATTPETVQASGPEKLDVGLRANIQAAGPGIFSYGLTAFQWKDVPKEQWPESPMEEYGRHLTQIPERILRWRWQGTGREHEVAAIYEQPGVQDWRDRIQSILLMGVEPPDIRDPRVLESLDRVDFWRSRRSYEDTQARIERREVEDTIYAYDPRVGRVAPMTVVRPMSEAEFLKANQSRKLMRDEQQVLTQRAQTISATAEIEVTEGVLSEAEEKIRRLRAQVRQQALPPGPEPTVLPAEAVTDEQKLPAGN